MTMLSIQAMVNVVASLGPLVVVEFIEAQLCALSAANQPVEIMIRGMPMQFHTPGLWAV